MDNLRIKKVECYWNQLGFILASNWNSASLNRGGLHFIVWYVTKNRLYGLVLPDDAVQLPSLWLLEVMGQTLGGGEGQGGLACCSPWGCRVRPGWATELVVSCVHGGEEGIFYCRVGCWPLFLLVASPFWHPFPTYSQACFFKHPSRRLSMCVFFFSFHKINLCFI